MVEASPGNTSTMSAESFEQGKAGFLQGIQLSNSTEGPDGNVASPFIPNRKDRRKMLKLIKAMAVFEKLEKHKKYIARKKKDKRKVKSKIASASRKANN